MFQNAIILETERKVAIKNGSETFQELYSSAVLDCLDKRKKSCSWNKIDNKFLW